MAAVAVRAIGRAVCLALAGTLQRYGVPEEMLTDIHTWRELPGRTRILQDRR
jgi:hypothetical protein